MCDTVFFSRFKKRAKVSRSNRITRIALRVLPHTSWVWYDPTTTTLYYLTAHYFKCEQYWTLSKRTLRSVFIEIHVQAKQCCKQCKQYTICILIYTVETFIKVPLIRRVILCCYHGYPIVTLCRDSKGYRLYGPFWTVSIGEKKITNGRKSRFNAFYSCNRWFYSLTTFIILLWFQTTTWFVKFGDLGSNS